MITSADHSLLTVVLVNMRVFLLSFAVWSVSFTLLMNLEDNLFLLLLDLILLDTRQKLGAGEMS